MKSKLNDKDLEMVEGGSKTLCSTVVEREEIVFKKACPYCGNKIPLDQYDYHIKHCK